jgi:hypothetical protein
MRVERKRPRAIIATALRRLARRRRRIQKLAGAAETI